MRKAIVVVMVLFAACSSDPEPRETEVPKTKPQIVVPRGNPPEKLEIKDIEVGDGAEAKRGGTVTIHYVGVSWSTEKEFDSSWEGEPATFALGQLIPGWQEGIPGMKEGGRRQLTIPPDLAYGDQPPPGIKPGETLTFVIDLIEAG